VQIVSLPNLRIVDYGYGFTGSTHDSTAWEKTRIFAEHDIILEENEFIWGDSAYPIDVWVVAPYKKPESIQPDNAIFNNHVSMVRIRSEHAIGFLKGRFQSLKGLRVNIKDEASHKFATYWVIGCIGLHSFAMLCEAEDRTMAGDVGSDLDPFILEGLTTSSESEPPFVPPPVNARHQHTRASRLAAGKARREHLKEKLMRARADRTERHAQRRRLEAESSEDSD
jgi:hypothetical protein